MVDNGHVNKIENKAAEGTTAKGIDRTLKEVKGEEIIKPGDKQAPSAMDTIGVKAIGALHNGTVGMAAGIAAVGAVCGCGCCPVCLAGASTVILGGILQAIHANKKAANCCDHDKKNGNHQCNCGKDHDHDHDHHHDE